MGMGIVVGRDVLLVDTMAFVTMISEATWKYGQLRQRKRETEWNGS